MKTQPVIRAEMRSCRGSVLGPDTQRRVRYWDITLPCGHDCERPVRYAPAKSGRANGWHPRPKTDALPAPTTVRCRACK